MSGPAGPLRRATGAAGRDPSSGHRALVLVAHGSRRAASNEEVRLLVERLRVQAADQYPVVEYGFLELAEPPLDGALDAAVAGGASEVVVVPYFLAAGRHVTDDVPEVIEATRRRHPGISFVVTPHLGAVESLADLLLRIAEGAPAGR